MLAVSLKKTLHSLRERVSKWGGRGHRGLGLRSASALRARLRVGGGVQGYLAHKKTPTPQGPP